jgi:hypothetical protein
MCRSSFCSLWSFSSLSFRSSTSDTNMFSLSCFYSRRERSQDDRNPHPHWLGQRYVLHSSSWLKLSDNYVLSFPRNTKMYKRLMIHKILWSFSSVFNLLKPSGNFTYHQV